MHLAYIDDSRDPKFCVFTSILIPEGRWHGHLKRIKEYRRGLRESDGVFVSKEFHATDFVGGRGRIAQKDVTKWRRSRIFMEVLQLAASMEEIKIINICLPNNREAEQKAFDRLLNRINRTMKAMASRAILLCDEGKNEEYTRIRRKMGVFNPIPSAFGTWDSGSTTKNIPLDQIVEDPVFLDSAHAYFIQLVDFCAYALLRKESPHPARNRYGLDEAFQILSPVLCREASPRDPDGIVRY